MNTRQTIIVAAIAFVLILPLIFNAPWSLSDYVVAGVLLGSLGIALEVAARSSKNRSQLIITSLVIVLFGAYIWAELAVGVFTSIGS